MTGHWECIEFRDILSGKLTGVEVVPLSDLRRHISDEHCECVPILRTINHVLTLVHNSFDGREFDEPNYQEREHLMRTKPYSNNGIRRIPCARCGAPSDHQWQVCADGNQYRGVCIECDIDLNRIVLEFFQIPDRGRLMNEYERRARQ